MLVFWYFQGVQNGNIGLKWVNDEHTKPTFKENLGVKYICAECFLKIWLEAKGIFVVLLSQDGFESDCSETKFQTINS